MNLLDFLSEENRQKNTRWLDEKSNQFNQFMNRFLPRNPYDKGHMAQFPLGLMETISPATDVIEMQKSSGGLMDEVYGALDQSTRASKINALGHGANLIASTLSLGMPGNVVKSYDDLTKKTGANYNKFKDVPLDPYRSKLRAWHGSPHDIDIETGFNTSHIGSGEGNQMFGRGLYFTESPNIAKHYRDMRKYAIQPLYIKGGDGFGDLTLDSVYTEDNLKKFGDFFKSLDYYKNNVDNVLYEISGDFKPKRDYDNMTLEELGNYQDELDDWQIAPELANETINELVAKIKSNEDGLGLTDLELENYGFDGGVDGLIKKIKKFEFDDLPNTLQNKITKQYIEPMVFDDLENDFAQTFDNLGQGIASVEDADSLFAYSMDHNYPKELYQEIRPYLTEQPQPPPGKLYEVDIDAEYGELIDWDVPMGNQSEEMKKKLNTLVDMAISKDVMTPNAVSRYLDNIYSQTQNTYLKRDKSFMKLQEKLDSYRANIDRLEKIPIMKKTEKHDISLYNELYDANERVAQIGEWDDYTDKVQAEIIKLEGEILDLFHNQIKPITKEGFKKNLLSENTPVSTFINNWKYMFSSGDRSGKLGEIGQGEKLLEEAGIRGIQYKAAGSRNPNKDPDKIKKNFVIFDDKNIDILGKYGLLASPLIAGVGLLGNDNDRPY